MANKNSSRDESENMIAETLPAVETVAEVTEVKTLAALPAVETATVETPSEASGSTNRDQVADMALKLAFPADKTGPLFPSVYASKSGAFTYSSVRAGLSETHPTLTGDEKTKMVNQIMNTKDAVAAAAVIQLLQSGFRFSRFNGRQLKSGTRNVSIGMTNARDKKAEPVKKLEDYTAAELRELADLRDKAAGAKTLDVVA